MAFAAYLQENAILVLSRGGAFAQIFLKPQRGVFVWNPRPHRGTFSAVPKKKKANARGEGYAWNGLSHKLLKIGAWNQRQSYRKNYGAFDLETSDCEIA